MISASFLFLLFNKRLKFADFNSNFTGNVVNKEEVVFASAIIGNFSLKSTFNYFFNVSIFFFCEDRSVRGCLL